MGSVATYMFLQSAVNKGASLGRHSSYESNDELVTVVKTELLPDHEDTQTLRSQFTKKVRSLFFKDIDRRAQKITFSDGKKMWLKDGEYHREDGPAIETKHYSEWYFKGKMHRIGGPAIDGDSGHKEWWVDGKPHRLDGPAKEFANGHLEWWKDGKRERTKETNGDIIFWEAGLPVRIEKVQTDPSRKIGVRHNPKN